MMYMYKGKIYRCFWRIDHSDIPQVSHNSVSGLGNLFATKDRFVHKLRRTTPHCLYCYSFGTASRQFMVEALLGEKEPRFEYV